MNKKERDSKIKELQLKQSIKNLSSEIESQGLQNFRVLNFSETINISLWEKINKGGMIHRFTEWQLESLESIIEENLLKESNICSLIDFNNQTFIIEFSIKEIRFVFRKILMRNDNTSLFTSFFFTEKLDKILLIFETEYQEYEVHLFEE